MFVGRFGGDEFIGAWRHTSEAEVQAFLNALRAEVSRLKIDDATDQFIIDFAYGYALSSTQQHCTVKTLMDLADQNMYRSKRRMKDATEQSAN